MSAAHAERDDALTRLAHPWGLTVLSARRVRKVWQLYTESGVFCLKRSILGLPDLLFVDAAVKYLRQAGFSAVLAAVPTLANRPYASLDGGTYVLYPWLESREADFERPDELELAVRVLAELHVKSRGFVPYRGDPDRVRWGRWPQIFNARRHQLADFGERASAMAQSSPFCAIYALHFPHHHAQAEQALTALANSPYQRLSIEAVQHRNICHHDVSPRNLLVDAAGLPTLVDFDYCLADLRLHDLANLLLRLLRRHGWRTEIAADVLAMYHRHSPLDERDLAVLYPLLLWPQDFWQVGLQFFLEALPWPQERFLESLRKKTEDRAARAAFLEWYAREYVRG